MNNEIFSALLGMLHLLKLVANELFQFAVGFCLGFVWIALFDKTIRKRSGK